MEINNMKALSYEELRSLYKKFLHSQNLSKATINTAYGDTFYLWRKGSKDLFWNAVTATDFENEARDELITALSECCFSHYCAGIFPRYHSVRISNCYREVGSASRILFLKNAA
ncbi:hypothetical protein [Dehalobacter restrictus]|uniref:hypothetical protein n=1 Tax=Dehalobacter restrictus TaxID=55583 RepID=UPI00338DFAEC